MDCYVAFAGSFGVLVRPAGAVAGGVAARKVCLLGAVYLNVGALHFQAF